MLSSPVRHKIILLIKQPSHDVSKPSVVESRSESMLSAEFNASSYGVIPNILSLPTTNRNTIAATMFPTSAIVKGDPSNRCRGRPSYVCSTDSCCCLLFRWLGSSVSGWSVRPHAVGAPVESAQFSETHPRSTQSKTKKCRPWC